MIVNSLKHDDELFPEQLRYIDPAVKSIYWRGAHPSELMLRPRVSVVGSRKATPYGLQSCNKIVAELAQAGVVIISGLAFGIDAAAHTAALHAGGTTIAVLPSDTEVVYPSSNRYLAEKIVASGGTLLSEHADNPKPQRYDYIARNRIISGLADVILIPEATIKSGSLHTARFALDQGRTVMAIPGDINRTTSEGCNHLLKSGALLATSANDVFLALGYTPATSIAPAVGSYTPEQARIIELLSDGPQGVATLQTESALPPQVFFSVLTELELKAAVRPLGNGQWALI